MKRYLDPWMLADLDRKRVVLTGHRQVGTTVGAPSYNEEPTHLK